MTDTDTVKRYLERMDDELLNRDGSAELSHQDAKEALRDIYLLACGKEPEFHKNRTIAALPPAVPEHSDDSAVRQFSKLMAEKMKTSREKGRGGWDDPKQCSVEYLRKLLHEHVAKGDPVDVANICMMLRHYDASTSPTKPDPVSEAAKVLVDWFDGAIVRDYVSMKGTTRSLHSDTLLSWLRALTKDGEADHER